VKNIGVIGAGLAGLTVAFRRATAARGDRVTVFEATSRWGGQLRTARSRGYVVEEGAEGYVARSLALPGLAQAVGVESEIVGQSTMTSYRFDGGSLVALAPGEAAAQLDFKVPKDDVGSGIRTFSRGMDTLTDALANALEARGTLHLATRALRARTASRAVEVVLEGGAVAYFDALVVATSSESAASLLGDAFGPSARALAGAETLSSVTVSLAYPERVFARPLEGTGCVIATPFEGCRAITFTSSKFEGRAPAGEASLRVFFRPDGDELRALSDNAWSARAARVIERVLGVSSPPLEVWVSRWACALPVITPEHQARIAALENALAGSSIFLAGSAFHGSGIDAAVRSAEGAAAAIDACV
jgi:protoporphyrinogen/coproporphyrinogen III oxidase